MNKDYYEILGVKKEATQDEIKSAFKKLSLKYHPDRFATKSEKEQKEAEEKFKEISEAYTILSDENKRRQYDMGGMKGFGGGGPFNFNDIFGEDPFDAFMHGMGGRGRQRVVKGSDASVVVSVTLEDILYGCKKTITYDKLKPCQSCNGTGSADGKTNVCPNCNGTGFVTKIQHFGPNQVMQSSSPCPYCHGSGKVIKTRCSHCGGSGFVNETVTTDINIPAGVIDGATMKLQGEGNAPEGGNGVNGDLYIQIRVEQHNKFVRVENDVVINLDLTLYEAWCGCEKEITCLDKKKVKVKIPKLTKIGEKFRVRGKGLPDMNTGRIDGDMIVIVNYITPDKLTNKQEDLLKQFYNIK